MFIGNLEWKTIEKRKKPQRITTGENLTQSKYKKNNINVNVNSN